MIAQYGYKDGSGEFFISIDTDKCTGCGDCIPVCPPKVLEMSENDFDPLSDETMAAVTNEHRKKIKYSCAPCKPSRSAGQSDPPCVTTCEPNAIAHSW